MSPPPNSFASFGWHGWGRRGHRRKSVARIGQIFSPVELRNVPHMNIAGRLRNPALFRTDAKPSLGDQPCLRNVEEDGRDKTERVNPVEHAAMSLDQRAVVLNAAVAFDRRETQRSGESH